MVKQTETERPSSGDERNDSRFKGVRKRKWGKYVSEIRLPNSRERIWLGSYDTAEKAARAFDAALFCLRGRSAKFNFPDSPPEIPGGRSLSPPEIQAAAARFANSERPGLAERPDPAAWSPSPSVSEGSLTAQPDSELANDTSFMEFFDNVGSGSGQDSGLGSGSGSGQGSGHGYDSGYGLFPGFDDFAGEFFAPPFTAAGDYAQEDTFFDGALPQESFLWNF